MPLSMTLLEFVSQGFFVLPFFFLITFPHGVQCFLGVRNTSPYGFLIFELLRWGIFFGLFTVSDPAFPCGFGMILCHLTERSGLSSQLLVIYRL